MKKFIAFVLSLAVCLCFLQADTNASKVAPVNKAKVVVQKQTLNAHYFVGEKFSICVDATRTFAASTVCCQEKISGIVYSGYSKETANFTASAVYGSQCNQIAYKDYNDAYTYIASPFAQLKSENTMMPLTADNITALALNKQRTASCIV